MWSFKHYAEIMLLLYFFSWIHEWIISSTNKSSLLGMSNKSFCKVLWISINHPQHYLSCWGLCINIVSIWNYYKWSWVKWPRSGSSKGEQEMKVPLYSFVFWLYLPFHLWKILSMLNLHVEGNDMFVFCVALSWMNNLPLNMWWQRTSYICKDTK